MTSRRRWLALGLGGVAALAALALAIAFALRLSLAERLLLSRLAARGAAPASLRVVRLDAGGMALSELVVGASENPALVVASLELSWSLAALRNLQLDSLRVSGVRLRGVQGDRGLHFGALDGLWRGRDGAPGAPALPTRELEVRDATLVLTTPHGVATGELAGRLRAEPDGALAGDALLALAHPLARAQGTVVVSGTLSELAGELDLALQDAREPARVAPARLQGRLSGAARALRFDLRLEGAGGRLQLEARGDADLVARSARADLRLAPIAFARKGLQPATLVPALEALLDRSSIEKVSGRIEAHGKLELREGEPAYRLELTLRELGFESRFARVSGATGVLALRGPPLQTPEGQQLSVARLDAGVPLSEGLLEFRLRPERVLALRRTNWHFAGGELRAENVLLELGAKRRELRMQAVGLDLAALLDLVSLEGIDGSGRIDGELPLLQSDGALRIEAGVLRAAPEGGTIRYRPTAGVAEYAATRPNDLGIAVAALSDFHYDELEARLDGDLAGELQVKLHLRGSNPGFRDGYPIELNLTLDAELADVLGSGRAAHRVPREVEERLRRLLDEEKQ